MDKLSNVNAFFKLHKHQNINDDNINNIQLINKLYDLIMDDTFIEQEPNNIIEYFYFGSYYHCKKKYDLMEIYYLKVIRVGSKQRSNIKYDKNSKLNVNQDSDLYYDLMAMQNLGLYFRNNKKYNLMKKYYLIALKINSDYYDYSVIMYNLGHHYQFEEKDYDRMEKYYSRVIDKYSNTKYASRAMTNLGVYYYDIGDYDQMIKYNLMAINKGSESAMYNLGHYYQTVKDYDQMKKYYSMVINKSHNGYSKAINNLKIYYDTHPNDLSFIDLHDNKFFKKHATKLMNLHLHSDFILPKEYKIILVL